MSTNANPENRQQISLRSYIDSAGKKYVISTDEKSTSRGLKKIQGLQSFSVPNQEGPLKIRPRININPEFQGGEELEELIRNQGVLTFKPVVVENYFGIFRSREKLLTLIIHGHPEDWKHKVLGNFQSVDYFVGLRNFLLTQGIRPPQIFLSCDDQITQHQHEDEELKLVVRRFTQNYRYQVLGFPYLLNEISVINGAITVHEADMKQYARANSGSAFANPLTEDISLIDTVLELFDCPDRFKELSNERPRLRIRKTTRKSL